MIVARAARNLAPTSPSHEQMTSTRRAVALTLLLLSTTPLFAQPTNERWRLSVLASEISEAKEPWNDLHAGIGVGIAYAFAPGWDVELTVAQQSYRSPHTHFEPFPGGPPNLPPVVPVTTFRRYTVHPLDLSATRHFLTGSRFAPYLRVGARYVHAPRSADSSVAVLPVPAGGTYVPITVGYGFDDRSSIAAGAGVRVRLTQNTALRFEANRLLRDQGAPFDPLTRAAAGVSWKF